MAMGDGNETMTDGIYWNKRRGEFVFFREDERRLVGGLRDQYIRVPLPLVLILGPLMGLALILVLPLSGLVVLLPYLGGKVRSAAFWAKMAPDWVTTEDGPVNISCLKSASSPLASHEDVSRQPPGTEKESRIVFLANEIVEKRWQENEAGRK